MPDNGQLRLKRHFSVVAHSPDVVELRSGVWNANAFTLRDEAKSGSLFSVLSLLDGSRSTAEVATEAGVPEEEVAALLDHLVDLGAVEVGPQHALDYYLDMAIPLFAPPRHEVPAPPPVLLLGDAILTTEIERHLRNSLGDLDLSTLTDDDPGTRLLSATDTSWLMSGAAFHENLALFQHWRGSVLVLASTIINPVQLLAINRICSDLRVPWIHAAVDGPFLLIGPFVVPGRNACYECFESRVAMNLRETASYQAYKKALVERQVQLGSSPIETVMAGMVACFTAFETLNFLVAGTTFTVGKVLSIYVPTMEIVFNDVLRLPGCPACGSLAERDERQLYFDARAFLRGDDS